MDVKFQNPKRVLALKDRDGEALRRAASGGAFSVLARPILQDGGVVFGAHLSKGGRCCSLFDRQFGGVACSAGKRICPK